MRQKLMPVFVLSLLSSQFCGCSTLAFWKKKDAEGGDKTASAAKADEGEIKPKVLSDEQELKLAKLWARVDELEEEQYRQKERVRVLEKGMTLGLVPEELKHEDKLSAHSTARPEKGAPAHHKGKKAKKDAEQAVPVADHRRSEPDLAADLEQGGSAVAHTAADEPTSNAPLGEGEEAESGASAVPAAAHGSHGAAGGGDPAVANGDTSVAGLSKEDSDKYQALLANAHDHYRAGRYGRAIVDYSEIGKQFGDKVGGGMHLYWVAKCWMNLKEYNTSRQQLTEFLRDHAGSPWAPRAKLDLARVEWQLGMQETALQTYRAIIQEHPYEDAAEMAKMELENLDKKL